MMHHTPLYRAQWGMPKPPRYNKAPSKVVSIPVHFVGSERTRTDSATKIQKVARGFLVRNGLKKMVATRGELEQIENKVNAPETVELMWKDQRERVRVSETIMNLLLRLDSVRVLHYSALRDFRKSLIKRAIALQEMVDQMVGPTHQDQPQTTQDSGSVVADSEGVEALGEEEGKCVGEESVEASLVEENCLEKGQVGCEGEEDEEDGEGECEGEESVGTSLVEENCLVKEEEGQVGCEEEHEECKKMEALGNEEKMEVEEEEEDGEGGCVGEESVGTSLVEEGSDENCLVKEKDGGVGCEAEEEENCKGETGRGEEGDGGNWELLKRMMEDNEKMMEMMAQLFERNDMQTRLLNSLSQRVEQLERAFACDKVRRKKRRNVDAKHGETDPKKGCS